MCKLFLLTLFLIASRTLLAGDMIEVTPDLFVNKDTIRLNSDELKIRHANLELHRARLKSRSIAPECGDHDQTAQLVFAHTLDVCNKTECGTSCETPKKELKRLVTPAFIFTEQNRQHMADSFARESLQEARESGLPKKLSRSSDSDIENCFLGLCAGAAIAIVVSKWTSK